MIYSLSKLKLKQERNIDNMKIGIDLDGVVLDTEKQFRNAAELYDMNILKKNSLINNQEIIIENR